MSYADLLEGEDPDIDVCVAALSGYNITTWNGMG